MKPADYHAAARRIRDHEDAEAGATEITVLSSHSLEFLDPFLLVEARAAGLDVTFRYSHYGQIEQALLATDRFLTSATAVVVIALRIEDQDRYAYLKTRRRDAPALEELGQECVQRLLQCVASIRKSSDAEILLANFSVPWNDDNARLFDANDPAGKYAVIDALNRDLAAKVSAIAGVSVWDYAGLIRQVGSRSFTDQRLWQVARQSIATEHRPAAAEHLAASIRALLTPRSKCLVLDLDNTLWGGAAGDAGIEGIALGDDYPGLAYKDFQQAVLSLADQGVLLSICSKNDADVVRTIIDEHPEMLLRWEDFLAPQVNWQSKSDNLRTIAAELNIGLDALVLFDDNPVEREEVRINAPEVCVLEVPATPLEFAAALFASGRFDMPGLSAEDLERTRYYQNDAQRQSARSSYESLDEFLRSLQMTATVGDVDNTTIARATHLVAKTNQFNLTTRRHSEGRIKTMASAPDWALRWIRVADRFGDNGIIGVSATRFQDDSAEIDTFIMSCRVMNRSIEDAMLADIAAMARNRGIAMLRGVYVANDRNSIVADFYVERGFQEVDADGDDVRRFELDISASEPLAWPAAIARD